MQLRTFSKNSREMAKQQNVILFENKQIMEWSEKHLSGISLDMILSAAKGWVEVNDEQRR